MQPKPPVRAVTTGPVPLAAIPVPIVVLPSAQNERIASVRPMALTPMEYNLLPRLLNCLEYCDGHPTQCKDAVRRYNARNTPQKYDQHVKKTEALLM